MRIIELRQRKFCYTFPCRANFSLYDLSAKKTLHEETSSNSNQQQKYRSVSDATSSIDSCYVFESSQNCCIVRQAPLDGGPRRHEMDAWAKVQARVVGRGRPSNIADWNRDAWKTLEETESEVQRLRDAVSKITEETAKIDRLGQQATQLSAKHSDNLRVLKSGLRKSEISGWDAQLPAATASLDERLKRDAQDRLLTSIYGSSAADAADADGDAEERRVRVVNAKHEDGVPVRALQEIAGAANVLEAADRHRWVREWPVRLWVAWGTLCLHVVVVTLLVLPCLLRFAAGRVPWPIVESVHWRLYSKPPSPELEAAAAEYAAAAARVGSIAAAGTNTFRSSFNQFSASGRFSGGGGSGGWGLGRGTMRAGSGSSAGGSAGVSSLSGGIRLAAAVGLQSSSTSSSSAAAAASVAAMLGLQDSSSSSSAVIRGAGAAGAALAPAAAAGGRKGVAQALASFWGGGAPAAAAPSSSVSAAAGGAGGTATGAAASAAGEAASRRAPPPPPLLPGAASRAPRAGAAAAAPPAAAAAGAGARRKPRAARSLSPPRR